MIVARGPAPASYSSYRQFLPHLARLFKRRCAYCLTSDSLLGGEEGMRVDHFCSQRWHPKRVLDWSNLYYSCDKCNTFKSDHPRPAEVSAGERFVDCCVEDPDLHFRMTQDRKRRSWCIVLPLSAPARYTVDTLRFNKRRFLRETWRSIDDAIAKEVKYIEELQGFLKRATDLTLQGDILKLIRKRRGVMASKSKMRPFPL